MTGFPMSEAFYWAAMVFDSRGHAPMKGKTAIETVGQWIIAMNGTTAPVEISPDSTMGARVSPVHIAIWFNGWRAGEIGPASGWIAAGSAANEDTFITAMKDAAGPEYDVPE